MTSPIRKEYGPMSSTFECDRCHDRKTTQGAQYVPKASNPLKAERICGICIGLAADRAGERKA